MDFRKASNEKQRRIKTNLKGPRIITMKEKEHGFTKPNHQQVNMVSTNSEWSTSGGIYPPSLNNKAWEYTHHFFCTEVFPMSLT